MYRPRGLISSMVSSFDAQGGIDEAGLAANIAFQRTAGVKTIVILGGTGEPLSMTASEREQVVEASMAHAGSELDVISSALVGSPADIAADIAMAGRYGAKACMVVPPPFVRPSESDVYRYFTQLASASSIPLILFNVPSRVGFQMSAVLIERLVRDIDMLVGIKESSKDLSLFSDIRQRTPETFACLQGSDMLYLPSLAMGADGAILAAAAAFPEHLLHIERAMAQGDLAQARAWHYRLAPVLPLLYEASHPAALKQAIALRGYSVGATRPPLYGISASLAQQVAECTADLLRQLTFSDTAGSSLSASRATPGDQP